MGLFKIFFAALRLCVKTYHRSSKKLNPDSNGTIFRKLLLISPENPGKIIASQSSMRYMVQELKKNANSSLTFIIGANRLTDF